MVEPQSEAYVAWMECFWLGNRFVELLDKLLQDEGIKARMVELGLMDLTARVMCQVLGARKLALTDAAARARHNIVNVEIVTPKW